MRRKIATLLLSIIFLSGCTANITGEKRGFTYKAYGGEFVCSHEPMKVTMTIDEKALTKILEAGDRNGKPTAKEFPTLKEAVKVCKQLINNEDIK